MSAVTSSEMPINSDVSRHVNQRMFTIGCGQPLAKRWLGHEAKGRFRDEDAWTDEQAAENNAI
jgi:hypothetical protein